MAEINDEWEKFKARTIPEGAQESQVLAMRISFFAGALAFLDEIYSAGIGNATDEEFAARMNANEAAMHEELADSIMSVIQNWCISSRKKND